jgi:hypothetical protein
MTLDHLNRLDFVHNSQYFLKSASQKPVLAFRVKKGVCFDVADATKKSVLRRSLAAKPISTKFLYKHFFLFIRPLALNGYTDSPPWVQMRRRHEANRNLFINWQSELGAFKLCD